MGLPDVDEELEHGGVPDVVKEPGEEGLLDGFNLTEEDAEDLIMRARVAAGWITQEDYDNRRKPAGLEDLDEEARAQAESLIAAEQLLKGGDGATSGQ